MSRPQQPELARSAKMPPDNEPGHHPPKEQDKPDLDAFAAKLGTDPKAPGATSARKGKASRPKTTPAKAATRPAASAQKRSPAAPPKVEATPAKRPAAAPTARPESTPTPREAAQVSVPQPESESEEEPRLVGLMMMPLRMTVKRLEQLDRALSARLTEKARWARGSLRPKGR